MSERDADLDAIWEWIEEHDDNQVAAIERLRSLCREARDASVEHERFRKLNAQHVEQVIKQRDAATKRAESAERVAEQALARVEALANWIQMFEDPTEKGDWPEVNAARDFVAESRWVMKKAVS